MYTKSNLSSQVKFSICIITFRRPALLKRCLDSLSCQLASFDPSQYEVIVSDDCPAQSSYQVVAESGFATWIQGPSRGVAANRNNVANASHSDWILYLDDDEIADQAWLSTIYEVIKSGRYDVIEGKVQPSVYPDSILWYAPVISSGGAYCTANLSIRRDLLLSLGGFNENFSVSHEDTEMGIRIRQAGLRSIYLDQAVVFHPARKMSLSQVWMRMVNVQHQSFITNNLGQVKLTPSLFINLCDFTFKYGYRVSRFELAARQKSHWQRIIQSCIMLACTVPIGFLKTLFYYVKHFPLKKA